MAEADTGRRPDAAPVRTAMREHVAHRRDPRRIDGLGYVRVEDACDAAHGYSCGRPAARSARRSIGPKARMNASMAGRALAPGARSSADTSTATARCGPPARR